MEHRQIRQRIDVDTWWAPWRLCPDRLRGNGLLGFPADQDRLPVEPLHDVRRRQDETWSDKEPRSLEPARGVEHLHRGFPEQEDHLVVHGSPIRQSSAGAPCGLEIIAAGDTPETTPHRESTATHWRIPRKRSLTHPQDMRRGVDK